MTILDSMAVTRRVVRTAVVSPDSAFGRACRHTLTDGQYHQLLDDGYTTHSFAHEKTLAFALRMQQIGELVQADIDVIDLSCREIIGFRDFIVLGEEKARMYQAVLMPTQLNAKAQEVLVAAGFSPEEFEPSRFFEFRGATGFLAVYLRDPYRQKSGFNGLSQIMMSTAMRIIKGLGVNVVELNDLGDPLMPKARERLIAHYQQAFGAEIVDRSFGDMVIRI